MGNVGAAVGITGPLTVVALRIASSGRPYDEATRRDMNTA